MPFHDDTLVTLEHNGTHYIAMRRVVENLGIDWGAQNAKLLAQPKKFMRRVIPTHDVSGRRQDMVCIPVEKLALWLATIIARL